MYRHDYIRKIKDEASTQCNLVGLDVPSECFQVIETNIDESEQDLRGKGLHVHGSGDEGDDDNDDEQKERKQKKIKDRVIKDTLTVEQIGLFHKSIQLKIKDGPCFDLLPNIYK